MEQNQLQDDVAYLRNMIDNNRRILVDNGIAYISAGIYVFIGIVISYILYINGLANLQPALWLVLMVLLIIINFLVQKKFQRKQVKKTFASKVFDATWAACGIPIAVISVLFLTTRLITPTSFFIIISSILGIGYFLTGIINELRLMVILAFGWWLGTVLSILWKYIGEEYQLAFLFAGLIFIFEIVPGIIIYKKWKRIYNE